MLSTELREFLKKRPFEPFRLHLSSGETVEIRHPEMAIVSRTMVGVGVGGRGGVANHIISYNMVHIVKVEPVLGQRRMGRGARSAKG